MGSILSEERWARLIADVKQVSEANNAREGKERMETFKVFEIIGEVDDYGYDSYKWNYFKTEEMISSEYSFQDRESCLMDFLNKMVQIKLEVKNF